LLRFLVFAFLPIAPSCVFAQVAGGSAAQGKKELAVLGLEEAVETIATSTDPNAVNTAGVKLRAGGRASIDVLVRHLSDSRRPPSNYLTRAVAGEVNMGDHSDEIQIVAVLDCRQDPIAISRRLRND
jgi:hypothetical protein